MKKLFFLLPFLIFVFAEDKVSVNAESVNEEPIKEDKPIIPKISVEDLELKLKKAVEREDYEKAAKLRDKIKDLES